MSPPCAPGALFGQTSRKADREGPQGDVRFRSGLAAMGGARRRGGVAGPDRAARRPGRLLRARLRRRLLPAGRARRARASPPSRSRRRRRGALDRRVGDAGNPLRRRLSSLGFRPRPRGGAARRRAGDTGRRGRAPGAVRDRAEDGAAHGRRRSPRSSPLLSVQRCLSQDRGRRTSGWRCRRAEPFRDGPPCRRGGLQALPRGSALRGRREPKGGGTRPAHGARPLRRPGLRRPAVATGRRSRSCRARKPEGVSGD